MLAIVTTFLACFWVGLILSLIFAFLGGLHGHSIHIHYGSGKGFASFHFSAVLVFLTVLGGLGFLLLKFSSLTAAAVVFISTVGASILGGGFLLLFSRVILKLDDSMVEEDYELIGQIGYISVPVNDDRVGEMKYTFKETKRSISIRSETGEAIHKGEKVIILRVKNGIATVIPFEKSHIYHD